METVGNRLVLIGLLVLVSGFFSGSETAVFSLSRAQREALAQSLRLRDRLLLRLLRSPGRLIATILVGSELVNIAIGSVATVLSERVFEGAGHVRITVATAVLVLPVVVIFGEIIPKSIAIKVPEVWASLAARPLALFTVAVAPVRAIVRTLAAVITWPLGIRGAEEPEPRIREAEFRSMVDVGQEEGAVRGEERRLIHNVFEFADRSVGEIMTPSEKVFALSYDLPLGRIAAAVGQSRFSRIPIYRGRRDNIVGVLLAKDLVGLARGMLPNRTLSDLLQPPFYIPKASRCDETFRQMQRRRTHLAIVVDEYGRTVGLVTMEDLLQELFGETREERGGSGP